jgi:hypothetical protein
VKRDFVLGGCALAAVLQFVVFSVAKEPILIAQGTGAQTPKQPQAVVAADGGVHLVYGVGDEVFYCRSNDAGASFSRPKAAIRTDNMSLGMRRGPRVAVAKDAIVISAIGGAKGKGRDGDLWTWRSADEGKSWQGPVRVNDVVDSAREGLHAMASGADGDVWCVWLDLRDKGTQLFAARSEDSGQTWSKNMLVYRSPQGSICECCHPSIAIQGKSVYVLFRNSLAGNRDMYLTSAIDGNHFDPAQRLGGEHWTLNACPMDGGMLAVESEGKVSTVWRRGGLLYATRADGSQESLLGRGEQPWVAATRGDTITVWVSKREGELFATSLNNIKPRLLARVARDPVIASAPSGTGSPVVCWESKQGDTTVIQATTLESN